MYNYSPIRKLYIRNFRNLGDIELSFEKSPIITLVGENEAGKTSVVKAFATCALHANPREQKDYIRDGTKMFGVSTEFNDGTRVTRIKEADGINSYQITDENGNLVFSTNKLSEGLPVQVQNIMGLIAEPETNEFLHVRTYEDKLLFVVTPYSTNYKVMYNALKVEQLTKAIKIGSAEVNELKSSISSNEASIDTLLTQARAITIYDTEPLINVRNSLKEQMAVLDRIEKVKNLVETVDKCEEQMGAIALIDKFKLETIDEVKTSKLNSVSRLLNSISETNKLLSNMEDIDNLSEIDVSVANKVGSLLNKVNMLDTKIKEAGTLVSVNEISEISEVMTMQLNNAMTLLQNLETLNKEISLYDVSMCSDVSDSTLNSLDKLSKLDTFVSRVDTESSQLEQINVYIGQVQDYLKQCGVAFETCPNCGTDVIIDMDKLREQ